MTEPTTELLHEINAPYARRLRIKNVSHDSGMNMIQLEIKEGHRFTMVDLDPASATELKNQLEAWLEK